MPGFLVAMFFTYLRREIRRRKKQGIISPRTVDKHIQHALDKLGVRTRVQAIALIDQAPAAGVSPVESAPA